MVQEELNAVCERVAGCETVAFVDLSTSMSLVTNATSPESQDTIKTLTAEAVLCLKTGGTAMICHATRTHLFLQSPSEPNDGLCCILTLDADLGAALEPLRACLAKISDDGAAA